jgi:hypothetical protein
MLPRNITTPVIAAVLFVLFSACSSSRKPITNTTVTTIQDSISVSKEFIPRDTIVIINKDSSEVIINLDDLYASIEKLKLSNESVVKEYKSSNGRSNVTVKVKDDQLIATCECSKEELIIKLQDQLIKELHQRKETTDRTIQVPVKYVPKITAFMAKLGWILIGAIGIFGLFKLLKLKSIL